MCLIACAPKGADKYSEFFLTAIKKASVSNTDGIGYSFKRSSNTKKVWISKGFKDIDKFIETLKSKKLKINDELVIHLRIGNKGAKSIEMNHPFVISNKPDEILENHKYVDKSTMCHNGTFFNYSVTDSLLSDTYFFTKDFLAIPELETLLKRDKDLFAITFKEILRANRVAVIFNEDIPMITLGEFIEDEGYFFSNKSYKEARYSNVGGTEYHNNQRMIDFQNWRADIDDEDNDDVVARNSIVPALIGPTNSHISNIRRKVFENGKKVGERARNTSGFLEANSKFDIIAPAGANSVLDLATNVLFYEVFGGALYVPLQYTSTQEMAMRFVPRMWNWKHFTYLCTTSNFDKGFKRNTVYEIREFDVNGRMHEIWPQDPHNRNLRDCTYVSTLDLVKNCLIYYKNNYPIYMGVFRLMKKYDRPSKNLFTLLEKVINKAIKSKLSINIKFKDIGGLELKSLQIYQNYMGEVLYDKVKAASVRNNVQLLDVWVN